MGDPTIPSFSTRLWSDEVGLADPEAGIVVHGGSYSFSGGRVRSDNTLYDPRPVGDDSDCVAITAGSGGRSAALASVAEHVISHVASSTASSAGSVVAGVYLDTAISSDATASSANAGSARMLAVVASPGAVSLRNAASSHAVGATSSGAVAATRNAGGRVAAASTGGAATLFVAPNGSNANNGRSILAPFLTIAKAASVAVAGDVVQLADGNYNGGVVMNCAGTLDNPITFLAASRWGAKIVYPATSTTDICWLSTGDYVVIDGVEVDGTIDPEAGPRWRTGLYIRGEGSVVQHCHVHHLFLNGTPSGSGGAGILADSYYGGQNMAVLGNRVHHCGPTSKTNWYHGIYMTASGRITDNVSFANSSGGIHLWHDVSNVVVANNTVFANLNAGIIFGGGDYVNTSGPADYITVINNIVYDNDRGILELGDVGSHNVVRYNLCNGNGTNYALSTTHHTNDVTGNPLFVNYQSDGSGDYALATGSPARGTASDGGNLGAR